MMTREEILTQALEVLLEHYLKGANSGDGGFWEPEEEDIVIATRKVLDD